MKRAIEKMKEEEITNQNRKKHPYTERNKDSFSFSLYENKKRIREEIKKKREHEKKLVSPGLCRYNPKYKSIEKHTRRVIFSFKNFKKFNTTYNHKLMIKKKKIKEEDNILKTKIENMKKKLDRFNFKIKNESREKKEKREKREKKITKTKSIENNKGNDIIPKLFQNTEINKKSRKFLVRKNEQINIEGTKKNKSFDSLEKENNNEINLDNRDYKDKKLSQISEIEKSYITTIEEKEKK